MAEQVKLYGTWSSPFSRRVELALKLKGVPYEYFEEDLLNKSSSLLKYNPVHKKIPVLVHNEKPIAESLVILEYIDETWKNNPILPQDPYQRAMARFWAKFIDDKVLATGLKANLSADENEKEKLREELCGQLKFLESELKGKEFFGGETIGLVDITANIAFWLSVTQEAVGSKIFTEDNFPLMYKWIERLKGFDAVKESIPPREKLLAYVKARLEAVKLVSAPK